MTPKQAYKIYIDYYRDNTWNGEDIRNYLKPNFIDFEEFTYGEFKDMVLNNDKFNNRWGNGCREELKKNKDA